MTTYLTGSVILLLVISPLLVPITVSVVRAIANWRTTFARLRALVAGRTPARNVAR
jgi:hypothetical protein